MGRSPTALTMKYLRTSGYLVDVVERFIHQVNIKRDLFGVGDLAAITIGEPVLLVQATSLSNLSARVKKCRASGALAVWLKTGARFQLFGWTKRAGKHVPKIIELKGEDLHADVLARPPRRTRSRHRQADLFTGMSPDADEQQPKPNQPNEIP